jgi:hypothetical protein
LEAFVQKHGTVHLKKIDVVRWGSPVAEQFGIDRLPTLHLYDGTQLVSQDTRQIMTRLAAE